MKQPHDQVVHALAYAEQVLNATQGVNQGHPVFGELQAALRIAQANPLLDILAAYESENSEDLVNAISKVKAMIGETPIKAALRAIGFKSFDKEDWSSFAGCESADPLILHGSIAGIVIYDVKQGLDGVETLTLSDSDREYTYELREVPNG